MLENTPNRDDNLIGNESSAQPNHLGEIKAKFGIDIYERLINLPFIANFHNPQQIKETLNTEFGVFADLLGENANSAYFTEIANFLSSELEIYPRHLESSLFSVRVLINAWGQNISNYKFKASLDTALRIQGMDTPASAVIETQITPYICVLGHKIQDLSVDRYMHDLKELAESERFRRDAAVEIMPDVIRQWQGKFQPEDYHQVMSAIHSVGEALYSPRAYSFKFHLKDFVKASGSGLIAEKLWDMYRALSVFNEQDLCFEIKHRFLKETSPQLLRQFKEKYEAGALENAAVAISNSLQQYEYQPGEIPYLDQLLSHQAEIERLLASAGTDLKPQDVAIIVDSMPKIDELFTRIRCNPNFGMRKAIVPIAQSLGAGYYPEIFLDIAKELTLAVKDLQFDIDAKSDAILGATAGIKALGVNAKVADIREIVNLVAPLERDLIHPGTSESNIATQIFEECVSRLKAPIGKSDIKILIDSILEFEHYKYPASQLKNALPDAIGALGIAEGIGLLFKLSRMGIASRLDILSEKEIKDLNDWARHRKPYDIAGSAELKQRARELQRGANGSDFLDKIIAAELTQLELLDNDDANLVGSLMGDFNHISLTPTIKINPDPGLFSVDLNLNDSLYSAAERDSGGYQEYIALKATKGLIDFCHQGLAGEPMSSEFFTTIINKDFQPIRMCGVSGENFGVIYTSRAKISEQESLVITGIHPKAEFLKSVNIDQFACEVIKSLTKIARDNKLQIYFNTGSYNWSSSYGISKCPILERAIADQLAHKTIIRHEEPVINYPIPHGRNIHYILKN